MRRNIDKIYLVYAILFTVTGFIGLIIKTDLIQYLDFTPTTVLISSILLVLMGISFLLMLYVRGFFSSHRSYYRDDNLDYLKSSGELDIDSKFEKFKNEILSKVSAFENPDAIKTEIEETIKAQVSKLSEDRIIEQISNRFDQQLLRASKLDIIEPELFNIKNRIQVETNKLSRYGYINLMIGFITTFMAIFFLGYSLLGVDYKITEPKEYIYHFIPRLSLSILIELFSFFFLRLYKKNLEDIKYLNNERTNIEMKIISIKTAFVYDDKETIKILVSELAKTERNFILKKDETTVEIEKTKIDTNSNDQLLGGILKILDRK